jgi:NTE family protein
MKALVLSGGSVKGCFQAGAIKAVIESGFIPDIIYGISVGSLNGSFLASAAGKFSKDNKGKIPGQNDWNNFAKQLWDFWSNNILGPSDIAIQRNGLTDVWDIIFNKFQGLSDTTPINKKVDKALNIDDLKAAATFLKMKVGTVDFNSTELLFKCPEDMDFINFVKGSIAIPVAMPPNTKVKEMVLFDGGVREVAPLGTAIKEGATQIMGILCQSENLVADKDFTPKKLLKLIDRLQDIIVNQNVNNDSKLIVYINTILKEAQKTGCNIPSLQKYKLIDHLIIRPKMPFRLDITKFTSKDIKDNLQLGYDTAKNILGKGTAPWL